MYQKILEVLKQRYQSKDFVSAVLLSKKDVFKIGTPCLVNLSYKRRKDGTYLPTANEIINLIENKSSNAQINDYLSKQKNVTFNLDFIINVPHIETAILRFDNVSPSDFYCVAAKPFVFDSSKFVTMPIDTNEIWLPTILSLEEGLKKNRFINYTFEGVKQSNYKKLLRTLKEIISNLNSLYPYNISLVNKKNGSFAQSPSFLIDIVSISFYRIEDVFPIFNHRECNGLSMEITMTTSTAPSEILIDGHSLQQTFRLIFSKYSENVTSMDGEQINNDYYPINAILELVSNNIAANTPNNSTHKKLTKEKRIPTKKKGKYGDLLFTNEVLNFYEENVR